jgi:hypothetical protein
MKKFLIVVLAAIFCLAFALPAMAVVKVGGMITTDIYYHDMSKEAQAGGVPSGTTTDLNGYSETQINLPKPYNRFNVRFNTDDNVLIGFIELRQGAANMTKNPTDWNYGWLMWQVSPALRLMVGRQTQSYSIGNPAMSLGFDDGHNLAGGLPGAPNNFQYVGAASVDAIRAYIRFTDNARLELQALDPRNNNGEVITLFPGETASVSPNEENVIPEFQAALPLTFGMFYLEPSLLYQQVKYDQVASGSDDTLDRFGICLLFRLGFGMMTLSGEVEWDQNVMVPAGAVFDGTNFKVDDATSIYAWLNLGIKFGASTLNLAAGTIDTELDGASDGTGKVEWTRYFYGISLPISVAKGFTIKPEATYYDYDDGMKISGSEIDMGTDLVVGVQFQLVF